MACVDLLMQVGFDGLLSAAAMVFDATSVFKLSMIGFCVRGRFIT
jgi:hypothetical protein